jgi:hypothetical protein
MTKVFTFGSNAAGRHGAGAAKAAYLKHGAQYGCGYGHRGNSFAIPTKCGRIKTLPIEAIEIYVEGFKAYAANHPELIFQVTRIGCGLAGYKDEDIAPMFIGSSLNCQFDESWKVYLGPEYTYWGHI